MQCAVWNCGNELKNKEAKKSFFAFPKDEKLCEKWLKFCRRPVGFKPKSWKICSDHFKKEDIVGSLAFEMGLRDKRCLAPGAVPCIYTNISPIGEEELKNLQNNERKRAVGYTSKQVITLTRTEENSTMIISTRPGLTIRKVVPNASIPVSTNAIFTDVRFAVDELNEAAPLTEIKSLQNQIQKLERENFELLQWIRRDELKHQHEKYVLQQKIAKMELEKKNMEEKLLGLSPAEHIKTEIIPGIIPEALIKMEIVNESSKENIENIMQQKLAQETGEEQILGILPEEQIKTEVIDENLEGDLEKDLISFHLLRNY
ncbi:PREDICTED: THAP domain-containing protein 5-like [Rhagoletis zephyria]|uniref:THAP domain-containing protein 5-like n=1 Tax=Rhagoletis zephyria TaxID=28612 RepID=UPI000811495A|nr:PREDICTED: THAP domain-containing protein 5-like [Rhagoletis zephyria]